MNEKVLISGFGGQGIMFLGKLLCQAGMNNGFKVTYIPSYGAEVRGGTAHCNIIISDESIASPMVRKADTVIALNEPSLIKFESRLKPKGLLLLNSSLITVEPKRKDIEIVSIPATDIAYELDNIKVTNMVMLGKYIACKKIVPLESLINNLKGPLVKINTEALRKGYNHNLSHSKSIQ